MSGDAPEEITPEELPPEDLESEQGAPEGTQVPAGAGGDPDAPADAPAEEPADELAAARRQGAEYLDALQRLQADFENYRKRVAKQQADQSQRAAESLVDRLLPALDVADLAVSHGGGDEVKQVWTALLDVLEREGLQRIDPLGSAFDPNLHDAVAHEPGDGPGQEVAEVMRVGYSWKGRVLRPALVKVRG